jgi:endonuclease III
VKRPVYGSASFLEDFISNHEGERIAMSTSTSKIKLVNHLLALHKGHKERDSGPVLEQFLYAIVREGVTRDAADQAFAALRERFFDWNELRVSSTIEIADTINEFVPDGEPRAQRLIDFLQEVFETTYSFDLESLQKKGVKQAAKQLSRYQAANDYAVAWVVQKSLGGHAIPLDKASLRVLGRLGMLEEGLDLDAVKASLEHQIPKLKGGDFVDLLSTLAEDHCWDKDPACPACPLHKVCPTGLAAKQNAAPVSKKPR